MITRDPIPLPPSPPPELEDEDVRIPGDDDWIDD